MDDWFVIAPTRWKLRKVANEILATLKLEQYPLKIFTGRAEQGFSFFDIFQDQDYRVLLKRL